MSWQAAAVIFAISFPLFLFALLLGFYKGKRASERSGEGISLYSKCPACGHRGCKLQFVDSQPVEVGEKREMRKTVPMVARVCLTCGATAYEKTVLDAKEWIA